MRGFFSSSFSTEELQTRWCCCHGGADIAHALHAAAPGLQEAPDSLGMEVLWIVGKHPGNDGNLQVWAMNPDVSGVGVQVWS